jgi:hypothetical protein
MIGQVKNLSYGDEKSAVKKSPSNLLAAFMKAAPA